MKVLDTSPLYDAEAVRPMREELVRVGFRELLTPEDVAASLEAPGTALVVVNSICGCAAGGARPGAMLAAQHRVIPDRLVTVFAGMERAATEKARSYFQGYAPSSPSIALLADGRVAAILERRDIEGRSPEEIARRLAEAFDRHCSRRGPSIPAEEFRKIAPLRMCGSAVPAAGESS
jgi:putative YphP/YqiW family bacilliredoxin